jgi:predicted DNA-binding transcriptional regulator YafY
LALYNSTLLSPLFPNAAYHGLLESALVKLQNALPLQVRDYVGRMKVAFSHRSPTHHHPRLLAVVRILQEQAADSCQVRMRYENLRGEVKERLVDPYCLRIHQGDIYLLGHCHLRGQPRIFLVDRIQDVVPLEDEFQMPPAFSSEDLLNSSLGIYLGKAGEAVLRFRDEAARYVLQRPLHPEQTIEEQSNAHVVVRVPVRGEREVIQAVLRFGALAEVLAPPELRDAARTELQKMVAQYDPVE